MNILPVWPYTSTLEPEVFGRYSSPNAHILLPPSTFSHGTRQAGRKLHPMDLVPQSRGLMIPEKVHTAPSASTKFLCSSTLFLLKTTFNSIVIAAKTKSLSLIH